MKQRTARRKRRAFAIISKTFLFFELAILRIMREVAGARNGFVGRRGSFTLSAGRACYMWRWTARRARERAGAPVPLPRTNREAKGARAMRITAAAAAAVVLLSLVPSAGVSQVFYQFPDAEIVRPGEFVLGPYGAVGDDELFRLGGFARMNATKYLDIGFELLFDSADGDGRYGAGGDLKFDLIPDTEAIPFDLAVTTGIGVIKSDEIQIIQFPVGGVISSPFQLDSGNILALYLGVYMLIIDTEYEGDLTAFDDTALDVEMRGGIRYSLSSGPDLFVGFQAGHDAMVTVGVSFWPKRQD
jgi:hypothetical protein